MLEWLKEKKDKLREKKKKHWADLKAKKEEEKQTKEQEEETKKAEEQAKRDERNAEIKAKVDAFEEEWKKKIEEMNARTKETVSKTPLYKQIEDKYNEKVLMPSLNQKKKILASIRDLHAPLNHEQLIEYW